MTYQNPFEITVIIPTYNRKGTLIECLTKLEAQTLDTKQFEVIVVDDGSNDGTHDALSQIKNKLFYKLSYFRQNNSGPAKARNVGIRSSSGRICLFTGDDIIVSPDFLKKHLDTHNTYPEDHTAVLGKIAWSNDIQITSFMRWLEKGGFQFAFEKISNPKNVSYKQFYTSNLSLKKKYLLTHGLFDEDFPFAAYEDYELGYRLCKNAGLRIVYNEEAAAFHKHVVTLDSSLRRAEMVGKAFAILHLKHPELRRAQYRHLLILQEYIAGSLGSGLSRLSFGDAVRTLEYKFLLYSSKIKGYRELIT